MSLAWTSFAESPALVADVGGTHVRLAVATGKGLEHLTTWLCSEYETIGEALAAYLENLPDGLRPTRAAIDVAGPVTGDLVDLTNQAWSFSIDQLHTDLELGTLIVVNDFTAQAAAIPRLEPDDIQLLKDGTAIERAAIAVLGPGTGLGVGGLIHSRRGWSPLSTEGGHSTLAATHPREWAVIEILRERFGRVSNERVLCGPGLVNLYQALCQIEGEAPADQTPAGIVQAAGEDPTSREGQVVRMFSGWLGSVAGDLVLTLGGWGGVYLGGGVLPKMGAVFDRDFFVERFLDKGRYRDHMEPIPIHLITNTEIAHLGLAQLLEQS